MELDRDALEQLVNKVVETLQQQGKVPANAPASPAPAAPAAPAASAPTPTSAAASRPEVVNDLKLGHGVFSTTEEAIGAAVEAFKEFSRLSLKQRGELIEAIRKVSLKYAREMADLAWRETKMGRFEDKILKNEMAAEGTPGVEMLEPYETLVNDDGMHVMYGGPWGVIGAITPVTNPTSTVINNAITMLAAGNTVVFCPHPQATVCTIKQIQLIEEAIENAGGPKNLITCVIEPTIRSATEVFKSDDIAMLCATGGPGVVRAAMEHGKRVIGAGPGNPPVLVDETADLKRAAWSIYEGAKFDNDLPCVGEKEIIVVDSVADELIRLLRNEGAFLITGSDVEKVTNLCVQDGKVNRAMIGQDAAVILKEAGVDVSGDPGIAIMDVDASNPLVEEEQLMPIVPVVRVRNYEQGLELAKHCEHGFTHTALIHTSDMNRATEFSRVMQTSITMVNGPSYCYTGTEGPGYVTLTVGTKTGDGVTNPLSFTRRRHLAVSKSFNIM